MCAFANYNSFWVPEKNLRVYYKEFGKLLIQHTYIHLFKTIQDYSLEKNWMVSTIFSGFKMSILYYLPLQTHEKFEFMEPYMYGKRASQRIHSILNQSQWKTHTLTLKPKPKKHILPLTNWTWNQPISENWNQPVLEDRTNQRLSMKSSQSDSSGVETWPISTLKILLLNLCP